ncbi:MAG: DNA polymerase/3'-5' exonuclease PolX [bacterium]
MKNTEIISIFEDIVKILELQSENLFKIRAYQKVIYSIEKLNTEIFSMYKFFGIQGLLNISGVGKSIAEKIEELLNTGHLKYFEELKNSIPNGITNLLEIEGLGPKKVNLFYEKLGIDNLEKLKKALEEHKIKDLPGMGEKTEENIVKAISFYKQQQKRQLLWKALPIAEKIIEDLQKLKEIEKISLAGSLRRMKETIGDIDILVASLYPEKVMDYFTSLSYVIKILVKGKTKSSILIEQNKQVDLRVVDIESFGAALMYFTGSKQHNISLRKLAKEKGLKINEYGLFDKSLEKIAGKTEEEVFNALGLSYISPELRENAEEIDLAIKNKLPELITQKDIKGDLHIHSDWSDGISSIEEIVFVAKAMGYEYIAICDHSASHKIGNGLSRERLLEQIKFIHYLNEKDKTFYVLSGAEVNIKKDGSLDYDDEILSQLDLVIASIHYGFKQEEKVITNRIVQAMKNKFVNIIAHPTGRLISSRNSYAIDMEKIFEVAFETKTFLELNSFPERLDLKDVYLKRAKEKEVMISIGTDAHCKTHLDLIKFGIATARRGWLEKKNLLNTLSLKNLLEKLKEKQKLN